MCASGWGWGRQQVVFNLPGPSLGLLCVQSQECSGQAREGRGGGVGMWAGLAVPCGPWSLCGQVRRRSCFLTSPPRIVPKQSCPDLSCPAPGCTSSRSGRGDGGSQPLDLSPLLLLAVFLFLKKCFYFQAKQKFTVRHRGAFETEMTLMRKAAAVWVDMEKSVRCG